MTKKRTQPYPVMPYTVRYTVERDGKEIRSFKSVWARDAQHAEDVVVMQLGICGYADVDDVRQDRLR